MRLYSNDFRPKGVPTYERRKGSQREWPRFFEMSLGFVQDLLQRYQGTGSVEPDPHGGGKPEKIGPYLSVVQQLYQEQLDASLAERYEQLATKVRVHIGRSTMHRALDHLGLMRKKRRTMQPSKTQR